MVEPTRIEKTAEQVRETAPQKTLPVTQAVPDKTKLFFLIAGAIIFFYYSSRGVSSTKLLMIAGIAAAIYYFTLKGKENPDFYLTEQQAKAALYDLLKFKQTNPYDGGYELAPEDKIMPMMPARLRKVDGKPRVWEIGFFIRKASGLVNFYSGEIHAKTGAMEGIVERLEGFSGKESPDVRYIRSPQLTNELRYLKAGGELVRSGRRY